MFRYIYLDFKENRYRYVKHAKYRNDVINNINLGFKENATKSSSLLTLGEH